MYPTNINGEQYPVFVASAAGWEPLHLQKEVFIGAGGDVHCEGMGVPAPYVTP